MSFRIILILFSAFVRICWGSGMGGVLWGGGGGVVIRDCGFPNIYILESSCGHGT